MSFDFGSIMAQIQQEQQLKQRWTETTPHVLVKSPAVFPRRGGKKYIVRPTRLGSVKAFELTFVGPRGGKKKRRHFDGPGGGTGWKGVEIRLATPEVTENLKRINDEITRLHREKKDYLRSVFWELEERLTWDDVQEALKPWNTFKRVLSRFKDGKATESDLQEAVKGLVPR